MNKKMQELTAKNATLYVEHTSSNKKDYNNLILVVTLDNGQKVDMPVKMSFYNHKLMYKLICHLPTYKKEGK